MIKYFINIRFNTIQIISKPKMRSVKWISTSIPESRWSEPLAQFSSVAYHVNNLVSPVLFNVSAKIAKIKIVMIV